MPKRETVVARNNNPLNFEELGDHTRPALGATDATLLDVLCVVGRDDVLARLGVVHDGLGVREEAVEAPVEDAGGDEGVDIADVETKPGTEFCSLAGFAPNQKVSARRCGLAAQKLFCEQKLLARGERGGRRWRVEQRRLTGVDRRQRRRSCRRPLQRCC